MSEPTSNLFTHLGKPVKDEYGNTIGTMASFLITPGGRIDGVFIKHGDGNIRHYSSDQIKANNDEITLSSSLKVQADSFCNQIPLLWRKTQAIKNLNEKNRIPEDMYKGLHSSFEGALTQLKTEAENTIANIDRQIGKRTQKLKKLNSALINLEIEREIGQISEESYSAAIEMIKEGLRKVNAEKTDFEALKRKLSNILLDEETDESIEESVSNQEDEIPVEDESIETTLPEPPETSEQQGDATGEQPVVVYVKNAEQTQQ